MSEVKMDAVESSNIAKVGYDSSKAELFIQFKDGGLYKYHSVGIDVYQRMMDSETHSVGQFFHSNVMGKFESEKIESDTEDTQSDPEGAGTESDAGEGEEVTASPNDSVAPEADTPPQYGDEDVTEGNESGTVPDGLDVEQDVIGRVVEHGYSKEHGLFVTYKTETVIHYPDVPEDVAAALNEAPNPSKYIASKIIGIYQGMKADKASA